jgi:hypothetical protein
MLLLIVGVVGIGEVPLAVVLGAANVAVGVLVHRLLAWPFRRPHPVS